MNTLRRLLVFGIAMAFVSFDQPIAIAEKQSPVTRKKSNRSSPICGSLV